jgi:hypothetical protein
MSSATMTRRRGARSGWLRISAAKASACSSDLSICMLSCSATGRKVSRTSLVLRNCLARGRNCRVCMLCSRSASFAVTTRVSAAIIVAVARVTWRAGVRPRRSSVMCPATIAAIPAPNSRRSAASVYGVSWTVSCKIAAHSIWSSTSPTSSSRARICATATGWLMYGSPLRRIWPWWHRPATSQARSIRSTSASGRVVRMTSRSSAVRSSQGAPVRATGPFTVILPGRASTPHLAAAGPRAVPTQLILSRNGYFSNQKLQRGFASDRRDFVVPAARS